MKYLISSNYFILLLSINYCSAKDVIYAVNCGGQELVDASGVQYDSDPLKTGVASDYGKNLVIERVGMSDQLLYQTERYDANSFSYRVPVKGDGEYVLVLKFSEVWFNQPNSKVFDVRLNGEHTIVSQLDIFAKVGRGVAHDEVVPFTVKGGVLKIGGQSSKIEGKAVELELVKGSQDNPKINAFYLIKGTRADVPELGPMPGVEQRSGQPEEEDEDEDIETTADRPQAQRKYKRQEARVEDPYAEEDASAMMLPIVIAVAAFIPVLYCLCRL